MRERLTALVERIPLTWRRPLLAGTSALLALVLLVVFFGPMGRPGAATRHVSVGKTDTLYGIGRTLEHRRVVRSRFAFLVLAQLSGARGRIHPGYYALSPGMSTWDVVHALIEGRGREVRVTVPEGWSVRKIAHSLEARGVGSGATFLDLVAHPQTFAARHPWLKALPPGASLEGYLFPDTYWCPGERVAENSLVDHMLTRFESVVLPAYQAEKKPRMSFRDALTLASIVELEAAKADERPIISGVFHNRLQIGMPLGSDPTVEYALGWHQGRQGLSFKDVRIDSPYNTYRYAGLPPGPICNPGLPSFQAALHPATTPYLFFVARGDGRHAFTRTYQEHLAAQRRLRS